MSQGKTEECQRGAQKAHATAWVDLPIGALRFTWSQGTYSAPPVVKEDTVLAPGRKGATGLGTLATRSRNGTRSISCD